jgi:type II secretion system protein H
MRIKPNLSRRGNDRQVGVSLYAGNPELQRGFSLMEMMIVIAIVGVLSAIAMPAFSSWRERQAVSNATSSLLTHLKQARNLAMAENRSVRVTFGSSAYTFDADTTGSCGPCKDNMVSYSQFSTNLSITKVDPAQDPSTKKFSSRGTVSPNTTLYLCASGYSKRIVSNIIGRAYICQADDTSAACTRAYSCQ